MGSKNTVTQTVTINWQSLDKMPRSEGTYLVAFSDGAVETYPITQMDIKRGVIRDGYVEGIYWANNLEGPQ